jgi:hypothetical protein
MGQREFTFEPRRQIRIFKPGALRPSLWCWACALAWLNEGELSHHRSMTTQAKRFRPRRCLEPLCKRRPSSRFKTKEEADAWWKMNSCPNCAINNKPSQEKRHNCPDSPKTLVGATQTLTTPATVRKSMDVPEDEHMLTASKDWSNEARRLQNRLSELNTRFRKVLNLIQDGDDKALSTPENALTLLHEIREQRERLQESMDGAIPAVAVLPLLPATARTSALHVR